MATALVFVAPVCIESAPAAPSPAQFKRGTVTISQGKRCVILKVEVASKSATRARGLMFRDHLAEGEGMLFIYLRSSPRAFWMKNTYVPLSVAYISSDWRINEIRQMDLPVDDRDVPSYPSKEPARYVLEVSQGWFKRNKFTAGARLIYRPEG